MTTFAEAKLNVVKNIFLLFITGLMVLSGCKSKKQMAQPSVSPGEIQLAKALEAHGGDLYDSAHYQFVFRGNTYTFKNEGKNYQYSVLRNKDGVTTFDKMSNLDFSRMVDGKLLELTEQDKQRYRGSLNSVIYFATLPHKLKDPAVNLKIQEKVTIKGNEYEVLEVSFDKEGGGEDHDDVYYYWINGETNLIDYLAYNFTVNKGGVRFRSAYNARNIDGIIFQDYINYKAPVGTALSALPGLFEAGELTQLSLIETEQVKRL